MAQGSAGGTCRAPAIAGSTPPLGTSTAAALRGVDPLLPRPAPLLPNQAAEIVERLWDTPDVRYLSGFGPWCGYDATTWYSGGHGAPDMLWYMPRGVAADVLNSLDALYGCAGPGHLCCIKDYSSREVELLRSYWALWYWRAAKGYALSTRLRGNASVVGHHTRVGGRGIYIGCGHRSRAGAGVVEDMFEPDVWPAP